MHAPDRRALCKSERSESRISVFNNRNVWCAATFFSVVLSFGIAVSHYLQKGDVDRAIIEYEKLVTFDSNSRARFLVHPELHYRLAKQYEHKGLKGKAIEQYQKFLTLWKPADSGLPEVEDARKRLAGLEGKLRRVEAGLEPCEIIGLNAMTEEEMEMINTCVLEAIQLSLNKTKLNNKQKEVFMFEFVKHFQKMVDMMTGKGGEA
jgi:tetratricopeptide (TPR) repeat protein